MVKHVVCFRLDDHSESAKLKAKEILLSMIGNVSLFTDITVGTDYVNPLDPMTLC
jgi:hypothetical protein